MASGLSKKACSLLRNGCTRNIFANQRQASRRMGESAKTRNPAEIGDYQTPTEIDKKMMLATKVFEKASDIPEKVRKSKISRARDLMRIRINIGWLLLGFIGEACAIMLGRRDKRRGDSVFKRETERYTALRMEGIKEEEEKAAMSTS